MNAYAYEYRIISSLKRGYRPSEIADWLGLSMKQLNACLQVYQRKYRIFSRKDIVPYFGGYLTKRCARCKRSHGSVYPVTVTSQIKQFRSYAHADCIIKWRRVSVVELDKDAMPTTEYHEAMRRLESAAHSQSSEFVGGQS